MGSSTLYPAVGTDFSRVRFALIPRDYNGDDYQDR